MVTEDCGRKISHTSKEIMFKLFISSKEIDSLIISLNGNVSMPLTSPSPRKSLHDREISCTGFHRSDGLWDIEGRLTDRKNYSIENENRGQVNAGEPIHDMWIRVTLDDNLLIINVEAATDASPYSICPDITKNFNRLKGITIGPGWRRLVQSRVGGIHGCTHLVELLGPIATVAYQTIFSKKAESIKNPNLNQSKINTVKSRNTRQPRLLNTCHAFSENTTVVKKIWPNYYKS